MRILITQESDWLGKGPHQQHHLAEKMSLRGHEIRVIDFEISWRRNRQKALYSGRKVFTNVSKVYKGAKVTIIRPAIFKMRWLDYAYLLFSHWKEIDRQIRDFAPDIIIGFGILNTYLALRAARKTGIPFIYYFIDVLHTLIPEGFFQPVGEKLTVWALKQSDAIIVINEKLREYVVEKGAPPSRTYLVGAGVDFERFNPAIGGKTVRGKYGIKEDDIVFLFLGGAHHFSGVKEVALELAKVNDARFKLLVVGDGDAYDELLRMRDKSDLREKLILTGRRPYDEIPALIGASDICLVPFRNVEITRNVVPIKMYEYMAMGKPVISTRLPGVLAEFGNDNGVTYVASHEEMIKKALTLVAEGRLNELGSKARSFAERLSWDNITDEFERILQETVEEKSRGTVSKRI